MKDLYSLEDIFDRRIFRIPDYQRGYSWEKDQLDEFWEDIVNLRIDREHYTGMISIKELTLDEINDWYNEKWLVEKRGYTANHIVDGQQRLTTFIILINEIINYYRNLPENIGKKDEDILINTLPISKIVEEYLYIVKPNSENQLKTFIFGYEEKNTSSNYFKEEILETKNNGEIKESFYTLNLAEAKTFFANNLKSLDSGNHTGEHTEIEELFIKLTQKLKFNIYDIKDSFNVFMAFETMNNRGKRLSTLELLKNRLIYLTTLFKAGDDIQIEIRNKINDTWKLVYEYLGKNKEKKMEDDVFLRDHWIIYFGYSRNQKSAYNNFLLKQYFNQKRVLEKTSVNEDDNEIEENDFQDIDLKEEVDQIANINVKDKMKLSDISNYINSINNIMPNWYNVLNPIDSSLSDDIKQWLDRINNLGIAYFTPLITVVISKKDIPEEKKIQFLKAVERYIFVFFKLAGNRSNTGDSHYYGYANKLYKNLVDIDDIINDLENINCLYNNNIVDINDFIKNIAYYFKNGEGYYDWPALKYFLYEYETYLMKRNKSSQKIFFKDLLKTYKDDSISIEHIYPQTPKDEYWLSRFNDYTEEQKKCMTGSLGNLLPLAIRINESLQNKSFDIKKIRYKIGSSSEIEVATDYDEWNPTAILEHGKKMLSFMEERWAIKFRNDYDKVRMLGLDFLEEAPEDYNQINIREYINKENKPTNIDKWKYDGDFYNNKKMIQKTIVDYINKEKIESFDNLSEEFKSLKMHSHTLFKSNLTNEDKEKGYSYVLVNSDFFSFYVRNYGDSDDTEEYVKVLLKNYECDLERITDETDLNKNTITREMIEKAYDISKQVYEKEISYLDALDSLEKHIEYIGGNKGLEEVLKNQREFEKLI